MITDLRLALPVGVAWVVLACAIEFPSALLPGAVIGWSTVAILLAVAVRHPRPVVIVLVLAVAAVSLVISSAAVSAEGRRPAILLEAAASGRFVLAEAVTTQTVLEGSGSFTVELLEVGVGSHRAGVSVPVRVFGSPATAELGIGARIRIEGTLAATEPADDIAFLVFTGRAPTITEKPPAILEWANDLRARFRATARTLPGDGGALLPGLAIGDTGAVGPALDQAMKDSSLSHLTAVSGANCAVVIGLIMVAGARLGLPRGLRVAASVAVLVGFVLLVTPEPSVLRAAVMVIIVLVALARGRPARGIPVVSLAVIVLLTVDPWLSREYGFVLSVLATAGLLLLSGPLTAAAARLVPRPIAAAIAIPLAAQLACQPVLILLAPSISTYGVLANILAGPAAPVATVLGLISCVLLPFAPVVGDLVARVAWITSAWIAAVAEYFAALPGARTEWPPGVVGVCLVALITVLALLVVLRRKGLVRRAATVVLALLLVIHSGLVAGTIIRTAVTRPGDWQYAGCDVGQGDAVLVRSADRIALVDTGPDPALLTDCLDRLGIRKIDLLILSHFDLDHVGGTSAVVGRVGVVLTGPSDGDDADRLVDGLADGGAEVQQVHSGLSGLLGELRWSVLWPPDPLRGVQPGNAASVAVRFDGVGACRPSCISSVFLGDLGRDEQAMLVAVNRLSRVDVVKVAHHGSADQSPRLYVALGATLGLIEVGAENTYGHPTKRLLDVLTSTGTAIARTDREGLVLIAPAQGGGLELWTERGG